MAHSRVADLSVDELKDIVRETVTQTLREILSDPDEGLELREDFTSELRRSLTAVQAGAETVPAEEVAARSGLVW